MANTLRTLVVLFTVLVTVESARADFISKCILALSPNPSVGLVLKQKLEDSSWGSATDRVLSLLGEKAKVRSRDILTEFEVVGDDLVITVGKREPVFSDIMMPTQNAVLRHALALPRQTLKDYYRLTNSPISPQTIAETFEFVLTAHISLAALVAPWPSLHVKVSVENRGTNSNSRMRPGRSADWIPFISETYLQRLKRAGAEVISLDYPKGGLFMAQRIFDLEFDAPLSSANSVMPLLFIAR
jgi:hypothetical protein